MKKAKAKKISLLDVPMSHAKRRIAAGEQLTTDDKSRIVEMNEDLRLAVSEAKELFIDRVKSIAPWFDFSGYSYARLCGTLTKNYPGESLTGWMDIPLDELQGYIDAISPKPIVIEKADEEIERAIVLWNANPTMTKKELENRILGGNASHSSHRSFFTSIANYSKKRYGKGHLREGNPGSPRINRE